jgi:hypothetical protein
MGEGQGEAGEVEVRLHRSMLLATKDQNPAAKAGLICNQLWYA